MKIASVSALFTLLVGVAFAQQTEGGPIPAIKEAPGVLDGTYVETHVPLKKPIQYDYLREADAVWTKRVWRSIDLRERANHPLYYPHENLFERFDFTTNTQEYKTYENSRQWSLWRIIKYHAFDKLMMGQTPDITIFRPRCEDCPFEDGDGFKYPVVPMTAAGYRDSSYIQDVGTFFNMMKPGIDEVVKDEYGDPLTAMDGSDSIIPGKDIYIPILSQEVVRYDLKEEWFFDKERSVLDVRVLGIAPVVIEEDASGNKVERRKFWIYFPECRYVFCRYFVFNTQNDAMRMSYDDIFWKRQFTSYITKENNVYDREINDYKLGVDALLDSERIKEEIFKFEHDVWHF
jgi:gliding motility associated protien GldN